MNTELTQLIEKAGTVVVTEEYARRTLLSMDLTSLGDDDTNARIVDLCSRAVTPVGHVAAVCVYDKFVPLALKELAGTGVRVATVCNFPHGSSDATHAAEEARKQVESGAQEVDVVLPYTSYMAGDRDTSMALLRKVRAVCTGQTKLKVIIESGALHHPSLIRAASRDAIAAGADFIKTSTGKMSVGATLGAAAIMLSVIREKQPDTDRVLGFKPAGGLKTVADSAAYLFLADQIMGEGWATSETLRFGASGLLNTVLDELELPSDGSMKSRY